MMSNEDKSHNEDDDTTEDSSGDIPGGERKSRSLLRDAVHSSMVPKNFESLKKFFNCSDSLGVHEYMSDTTSQLKRKGPSEALKAFHEISYTKFKNVPSSEEESYCSKCSHEDSEDSGLFKEGYVFERKFQQLSKNAVNKKVKKWKERASEQLKEVNELYQRLNSRNREKFSLPLGLEVNRRKITEPTDDASSLPQSKISGQYNSEDEMDLRRNDEFIREVQRVLKSKKNPRTLEKRSLPEEYSRLIFKKTAFARNQLQKALTENEHANENTDTGAQGDNTTEPSTDIFDQLSKMVLKNKIAKHSKAAQLRNQLLRRVEESRGLLHDIGNSDIDEKFSRENINKPKNEYKPQPGPSASLQIVQNVASDKQRGLDIAKPDGCTELAGQKDAVRLRKVESYLSSISDVHSVSPAMPEISELSPEREQSIFDRLAGEFLKNMATGNERSNKITRNDKKLLTIIVKRYICRGELAQIDRLMNSDINENVLEVPRYENVKDREEFFLKKIMGKFIKRGSRNALEDLIAWIYYKLDDRKAKELEKHVEPVYSEKEIQAMVKAFKTSGKNPSMNKIVMRLLKEHTRAYPGLSLKQIEAVKEMINNLVIERFARIYLERTKTELDLNSEPPSLAVNVMNEFQMNSGVEHIDVDGRNVEIKWHWKGETEQSNETNSENETDELSLADDASQFRNIVPEIPKATKVIKLERNAKYVKERLEDIVWKLQQTHHRQKTGRANRTCSLVKKRSVTMIGDQNKGERFIVKGRERKLDFEERRKQMREEHAKWLLKQKEMLREAKKREASNIEKYTQALPRRLESMIARHNRSIEQLDCGSTSAADKSNRTAKLRKK